MTPRKKIMIAVGGFLLFVVIVSLISLLFIKPENADIIESGGSGQPNPGTVILTGLAESDQGLSVGELSSTRLQYDMRNLIGLALEKHKKMDVYTAAVTPGSVKVNLLTNDVVFTVTSNDPAVVLSLSFNTKDSGNLELKDGDQTLTLDMD